MSTAPLEQSPEEIELARKRAELAALEPSLAERELELATMKAALADFERRYLTAVGVKYAQLDEIEAMMYEAAAKLAPEDESAQVKAVAGREQAQQSAQAASQVSETKPHSTAPKAFRPTENLKKLYREVAKALHPDLADGEEDRDRRHQFMIRANDVYAKGNEEGLRVILREWQHSPEFVKGDSVAAELVRMIRKIARGQARLGNIIQEEGMIKKGDLYLLKVKAEQVEGAGRNLLDELSERLTVEIQDAHHRLTQYQKALT